MLTVEQVAAFFDNVTQIVIPYISRIQLHSEGIASPDSLVRFDADNISTISDNLMLPEQNITNPNHSADAGETMSMLPFVFGTKIQMTLVTSCDLVWHCTTVGRDTSVANIRWNPGIRNFRVQLKALKDCRKNEDAKVPKISKILLVIKWSETFT